MHQNRKRFLRFAIALPITDPRNSSDFRDKRIKAMLHYDVRVRWKVASDLRFRAAISEPKTPLSAGILAIWLRQRGKSLAIAIVRFWCAKHMIKVSILPKKSRHNRQTGHVKDSFCGFRQERKAETRRKLEKKRKKTNLKRQNACTHKHTYTSYTHVWWNRPSPRPPPPTNFQLFGEDFATQNGPF